MTQNDSSRTIAVICPTCGAGVGFNCKGMPEGRLHRERVPDQEISNLTTRLPESSDKGISASWRVGGGTTSLASFPNPEERREWDKVEGDEDGGEAL